jgi:serine/threonine protein kinase
LRTIGEGGMGSVWAAHHELIGRDVAIKVTGERLARRAEIRDRFQNEARAVGKLRHPNIIDVMDVGQLPDGSLYIVFELLQGNTLAEQIETYGRFAGRDAVAVGIEICRALEAAHAAGVVHRDLKPANVFLHKPPNGTGVAVKVLDFGISKSVDEEGVSLSMTQTGVVLGTPQYMSFEQARGIEDVDLRTDIWGVGAILYELISGRLPFEAPNYNAMLYKILHDDPPPMSQWGVHLAPELERVLTRCFAKQRGQRYPSARELREALASTLDYLPVGSAALHVESSVALLAAPALQATTHPGEARPTGVLRAGLGAETLAAPPSRPPPTLLSQPVAPLSSTLPDDQYARPRRRGRGALLGALVLAAALVSVVWTRTHRAEVVVAASTPSAAALDPQLVAPASSGSSSEPPSSGSEAPSIASAEALTPAVVAPRLASKPASPPRRPRNAAKSAGTAKLTNVESAGF